MNETIPLVKAKSTNHLKTHIKVCVYVMIYGCAMEISGTVQPQYMYSHLQSTYNKTNSSLLTNHKISKECDINATSSATDEVIQRETSNWTWYVSLAQAAFAIPVLIFAGPLADKIGRKPLILWNVTITSIAITLRTFIVYKNLSLYYYVLASGILGISGLFYTFHLANLAILADTSDKGNERSFLVLLYDSLLGLGTICSQIGAGYLIQLVGFTPPYLISSGMVFVLLILIFLQLEDPWKPDRRSKEFKCKDIPLQLCSLWQVSTFGKTNLQSLLSNLSVYVFVYIPLVGFFTLRSIYILGQPFCWTPEHIGWYNAAVDLAMYFFGGGLVRIFQTCTSVKDEIIVLCGQISAMSCFTLFALSGSDMMLYIATATGVLRILPISIIKAMLSRRVGKHKQGVLFSNIYVIEAICNLGAVTIFTNIYNHTLSFYHGLVFFVMAAFNLISFTWLVITTCCCSNTDYQELLIQETAQNSVQKTDTTI